MPQAKSIEMMTTTNNTCKLCAALLDTPIGRVTVTACEKGIHTVSLTATQCLPEGQQRWVSVRYYTYIGLFPSLV